MERKLASIQKILDLQPIPKADKIEVATILGWHCVVQKGEFAVGDSCVFFEVDSLLPIKPEFEFLRKSCFNARVDGFRIKTVKLRGQISQGLALPITAFLNYPIVDINEGTDITEVLGVRKYEPPIPKEMQGRRKGNFPAFLRKTDEPRIQSVPFILERYAHVPFYVTEKMDGTSCTVYLKDDTYGVCSRNMEWEPDDANLYNRVMATYKMAERLKALGRNIAVQGEILGPGVQGNKYGFTANTFLVFSIFDIDEQRYLDLDQMCDTLDILIEIGKTLGAPSLEMVHHIVTSSVFLHEFGNVDALVAFATGPSQFADRPREGVVIRSLVDTTDPDIGRLSFKVINPEFLLATEAKEELVDDEEHNLGS